MYTSIGLCNVIKINVASVEMFVVGARGEELLHYKLIQCQRGNLRCKWLLDFWQKLSRCQCQKKFYMQVCFHISKFCDLFVMNESISHYGFMLAC